MSRFNTVRTPGCTMRRTPDTVNAAGGKAYSLDAQTQLVQLLTTSLIKDTFYDRGPDQLAKLEALVEQVEPLWAAKAAVYARHVHGLRSITHALAAILAPKISGTNWARKFYRSVVARPDDMLEIVSFLWLHWGKNTPIMNAMKRGFGDVLSGLDEYKLGKYKGASRDLSMVDLVNLCHPKSTPALTALVKGTLAAPETWEVGLTRAGSDAQAKAGVWTSLLSENKLGIFAALRNCRNILQQAPDALPMLEELLTNPRLVENSKIFPFQIQTAIDTIKAMTDMPVPQSLLQALCTAQDHSLANLPQFPGRTLIALDTSGSMQQVGYGTQTRVAPVRIGALFAAALLKSQPEADFQIFGTDAAYAQVMTGPVNMMSEAICQQIGRVGHGTNFTAIFDKAEKVYDRVIILSDMQGWMSGGYTQGPQQAYKAYCGRHQADPTVYCWDLAHFGTSQLDPASPKVVQLFGWTDKVFDLIGVHDQGPQALVKGIEDFRFH